MNLKHAFWAVLALVFSAVLCSCDNEKALKLNGAWAATDNDEIYTETMTFTKSSLDGGEFRQSITAKATDEGEVHGYEITANGKWQIDEDGELLLCFNIESVHGKFFNANEIEEIKQEAKEMKESVLDNARKFSDMNTHVEGFRISDDGMTLHLNDSIVYKKM